MELTSFHPSIIIQKINNKPTSKRNYNNDTKNLRHERQEKKHYLTRKQHKQATKKVINSSSTLDKTYYGNTFFKKFLRNFLRIFFQWQYFKHLLLRFLLYFIFTSLADLADNYYTLHQSRDSVGRD